MRRIFYFRVAGSDVHLPKLIGAFIMFAAALLFVQASSNMFDSWDTMKYYDKCILSINSNGTLSDQMAQFGNCSDTLYKSTGVVTRMEHPLLTKRQFAIGLLGPMGVLLLWLAVFFFGYVLYRTDRIVLPIEERVRDLPDLPKPKFAYKKKR